MPRSRTRSRSRRRDDRHQDHDRKKEDSHKDEPPRRESKPDAGKNSEQEIVSVAIKQLPAEIRGRLEKLFGEGLLKEGDLDLRAITVFASLNEGLQSRVMNFVENERIYVANARSKSGFLIATCDKAKTGCLDARGLGAIDPWRTALVAMATPKQTMVELKPESDWLDQHQSDGDIKINVDIQAVEGEVGVPTVTLELPLSENVAAVKAKLVAMGVKSVPANRMKLHTEPVGFLKERYSFAYYNLRSGVKLALSERKRAGVRFRSDHATMPKRPNTELQPGQAPAAAPSPADALQKLVNSARAPKLPALPAWPKLPGLPSPDMMSAGHAPGLGMNPLPGGGPGATGPMFGSTAPSPVGNLAHGMRPAGAGGLNLPAALQLPGLGGLTLPKLLDAKAAGGLMPPTMPPLGAAPMPKVGGGLPFSMPSLGDLTKAPAGPPGGMGGFPPGAGMTMPGAPPAMGGVGPKVQSKAMPGMGTMGDSIPKMPGLPLTGLGCGAQPPLASAAVAAATAKGPPPA